MERRAAGLNSPTGAFRKKRECNNANFARFLLSRNC